MADGTDTEREVREQQRQAKAAERAARGTSTAKAKRPKRQPKSEEEVASQQASLHGTVVLLFNGILLMTPDHLRPTPDELDSMLAPAERIYLRHADVPESVSPDLRDGMLMLMAAGSYGLRIYQGMAAGGPVNPAPTPPHPTQPIPPEPAEGIRFARPGEGTGVPPEDLNGSPEQVLASLHEASYRGDEAQTIGANVPAAG